MAAQFLSIIVYVHIRTSMCVKDISHYLSPVSFFILHALFFKKPGICGTGNLKIILY